MYIRYQICIWLADSGPVESSVMLRHNELAHHVTTYRGACTKTEPVSQMNVPHMTDNYVHPCFNVVDTPFNMYIDPITYSLGIKIKQ